MARKKRGLFMRDTAGVIMHRKGEEPSRAARRIESKHPPKRSSKSPSKRHIV